jgi:hypothetical protein
MTAQHPGCPTWCDGRCYDGGGNLWNALGGRGIHESDSPPLRRRRRRQFAIHTLSTAGGTR